MTDALHLAPCSHSAARYAVMNWHYSHTMPIGKLVKYGIWERGSFRGCVLFGRGASSNIGSPFGLEQTEICELVRVALTSHAAPVSRIIRVALSLLKKSNPGLRLVVSFADSGEGHHGGIYQAGGWFYVGESHATWLRVSGRMVHPKNMHARYGFGGQAIPWLRQNVDPAAERVVMPPKHKYVKPLDKGIAVELQHLTLPYPSRSKQATHGDHPGSGGAAPTRALQCGGGGRR